jgi:outer membrane protein assembly factor BamA
MKKLLILTLALILNVQNAFAEDVVIKRIDVKGNKRVETATIEAFLNIPKNKPISKSYIDDAFRKTFDTGLFEDLKLNIKGSTLEVFVKENPTVGEVTVDGNDKIETDKILAELKVKERAVYKEADVQADVRRILTLYQRSGRFNVRVSQKPRSWIITALELFMKYMKVPKPKYRRYHSLTIERMMKRSLKA